MTVEEALTGLDEIFGGAFGAAGAEVVIEEFMEGEEASLFILSDGTDVLPVGSAQDHKRVGEGDIANVQPVAAFLFLGSVAAEAASLQNRSDVAGEVRPGATNTDAR